MKPRDTQHPLEEYPEALFDAVAARYEQWLTNQIASRADGVIAKEKIDEVVRSSASDLLQNLYAFLSTDVDEQTSNPLHILRQSTQLANELLASSSVAVPFRDDFEVKATPHDVFSLGPLTWRDLGDDVHEAGIMWGAWKAATVLSRRRNEGKIV